MSSVPEDVRRKRITDMKNSKEIAANYRGIAKNKCSMPALKLIISGIFAGAFIAFGAFGSQVVGSSVADPGLARLLGAFVFPVGLTLVCCVGTELFTGNSLLVLPLLEKQVDLKEVLRNWGLVYLGNLIGSLLVACLVVYSHLPSIFGGALADTMTAAAVSKTSLSFGDALMRGILCNILVCLAVWLSFAANEQAGKIIGLYLPTMLFVLSGFEHSIANMYFIPAGMMSAAVYGAGSAPITMGGFLLNNLLPVTIGNLIGGAAFTAAGLYLLFGSNDNA